jgi:hypothetical protein
MAKAEVIVHLDESARMTFEARITELETEQGELHRELARLRSQVATAREDASEMEKKAIAEGSEALALRAEVAALKAAAQWRKMDTCPSGEWVFILMPSGLIPPGVIVELKFHIVEGTDGTWQRRDGALLRGGIGDNFLGWLPIPAFPSGDGQ